MQTPSDTSPPESLDAVPLSLTRMARRAHRIQHWEPGIALAVILTAAEASVRFGFVSDQDFPPITIILSTLLQDLQHDKLWSALGMSLAAWSAGMLAVIAVAIPVGILVGASQLAYRSSVVVLEFLRAIPSLAALPLLIFIYGIGFNLALMLVVLSSIWPLLLQTMYGMHDVDPVLLATGRVYGLDTRKRMLQIVLPSIAPYVATGLRISATTALVVAIAVSLIVGGDGLGALIGSAAQSGQVALMYGRILVAGLVGLLLTLCLHSVEKQLLHWHASQRGRTE